MKKVLLLLVLLLPSFVFAEDYFKDINIKVNEEATFQLYADGKKVAGAELVLNAENNYQGTFEHLNVFNDNKEIKYEVKYLEDGKYRSLTEEEITYEKESKWIQVLPEDIEPKEEYVLVMDNTKLITRELKTVSTKIVNEYNVVDGKKSYYTLSTNPEEENIWTITNVPKNDLLYEGFEDYWVVTNAGSKRMALSGYNKGDWIDYVFKYTGKQDGYIAGEDAWYTTKVEFVPVEGTNGYFYITSHNIINDEIGETKYIGTSLKAESNESKAAKFLAFTYKEDLLTDNLTIQINNVLGVEEKNANPLPAAINPNTASKSIIVALLVLVVLGFYIVKTTKKINYINK